MRRLTHDDFERLLPQHFAAMRQAALRFVHDYDDAQDAVSEATERFRRLKVYAKGNASALRGRLVQYARWAALNYKAKARGRSKHMSRIPEDTHEALRVPTPVIEETTECPFCHKGDLNEYGACGLCHTIVPREIHMKRNGVVMQHMDLAVDFEYEKKADVAKALAKLTPLEQAVTRLVIMGNETLGSCAELLSTNPTNLCRVWATAKQKLQAHLLEYAEVRVVQKPARALKSALSSRS